VFNNLTPNVPEVVIHSIENAQKRLVIFNDFPKLSRTQITFQNFPGLENAILKCKDFQDFSALTLLGGHQKEHPVCKN